MDNLVTIQNGKAITTSLKVAEVFEKEHYNVIKAIKGLECSNEFAGVNFNVSEYTDSTGRTLPMFELTRDGFTFLAMGFTGAKAAQFKEDYIKAFNKMEQEIKQPVIQTLSPQLQALINIELRQQQIEIRVEQTESRVGQAENSLSTIKETIIDRDDNWRKWANENLRKTAQTMKATVKENIYQITGRMSYEALEARAHCDLSVRLSNLRRRYELAGATKGKIDNLCKLDVIEADPKLKEIYTSIIKEMLVKYVA